MDDIYEMYGLGALRGVPVRRPDALGWAVAVPMGGTRRVYVGTHLSRARALAEAERMRVRALQGAVSAMASRAQVLRSKSPDRARRCTRAMMRLMCMARRAAGVHVGVAA